MPVLTNLSAPHWFYPILFIAKVFLFALFYWLCFLVAPDSFRFGDDYGVTPISEFITDFYESDDLSGIAVGDVSSDLSRFQTQAGILEQAYKSWQHKENVVSTLEAKYDEIVEKIGTAIEVANDKYEKTNIIPLREQIALNESVIKGLPIGDPKVVDLRRDQVRLHDEVLQHYQAMVKNRSGFASTDLVEEESEMMEKISKARSEAFADARAYRELRATLSDSFSAARSAIIEKIGFADFIYLSACISTTTTFGDITANKKWLRLIVVLQIVIGIFILARMVEAFSRRRIST